MGRESEEGTGRDGSRNAYVALTLSVLYFFLLVLIKIELSSVRVARSRLSLKNKNRKQYNVEALFSTMNPKKLKYCSCLKRADYFYNTTPVNKCNILKNF